MIIEKLEKIEEYFRKCHTQYEGSCYTLQFMQHTIITFKDQSDEMAELRKELAQKENNIDVKNIKIGGTD